MKKIVLLCTIFCATILNGMDNPLIIQKSQLENKEQAHRKLLGKVRKLEGDADIYVGAGISAAGENIFFAMEKVDSTSAKNWRSYKDELIFSILPALLQLSNHCQNQNERQKLEKMFGEYGLNLMDKMCYNYEKFKILFGRENGIIVGISGFTVGQQDYIAYASRQPITSPFMSKKEIKAESLLKDFDEAYPNIIISVGVKLGSETPTTEHRGIFKNPFSEIRGDYKNIAMKLHGWAGTVEKDIFNKTYMMVFPTPYAAALLHKSVNSGDMYLGTTKCLFPYSNFDNAKELQEKFPPIEHELLGIGDKCPIRGASDTFHIFALESLSEYYTNAAKNLYITQAIKINQTKPKQITAEQKTIQAPQTSQLPESMFPLSPTVPALSAPTSSIVQPSAATIASVQKQPTKIKQPSQQAAPPDQPEPSFWSTATKAVTTFVKNSFNLLVIQPINWIASKIASWFGY